MGPTHGSGGNVALLDVSTMTRGQVMAIGGTLSAIGVVLLIVAIVLAVSTVQRRADAREIARLELRACMGRLTQDLGFQTQPRQETSIIARKEGYGDTALRLGEVSSAALLCPGWVMTSFCMGTGCSYSDGAELVLEQVK